jgi:Ni/Fe-hydrogenase 1 B-type cytochrome subunit
MSTAATLRAGAADAQALERVYVWELPVRLVHWTLFAAILILSFTGFYIGHPFITVPAPALDHFVMGWMKVVHFYAAIVFVLCVAARVVWMFLGNRWARWDQFIPVSAARVRNALRSLRFYLFLGKDPPAVPGHNALAGMSYSLVYLIYFLMIATGLAMYSATASNSLLRDFGFLIPLFGGLQHARWIHHAGMWLILGFFAHHLFSALLVANAEHNGLMESIFSGYKYFKRGTVGGRRDG